jgi:NAD-dependent deacetylase
MDEGLDIIRKRLDEAARIRVLTGAGVSAESGIPTFRGPGGLWRKFKPEELASPEAFARDPGLVWEWYLWRRSKVAEAKPNPAHEALADLERSTEDFWLVTQNVDGLHRDAGTRRLLELHGNIWRTRCTGCGVYAEDRRSKIDVLPPRCPACDCPLRPDIVWFGESLPAAAIEKAFESAEDAEVFLVAGTAGLVQPAASLAEIAKRAGAFVVEINLERTPLSSIADASLLGPAGRLLPAIVPREAE